MLDGWHSTSAPYSRNDLVLLTSKDKGC